MKAEKYLTLRKSIRILLIAAIVIGIDLLCVRSIGYSPKTLTGPGNEPFVITENTILCLSTVFILPLLIFWLWLDHWNWKQEQKQTQ